MFRNFFQHCNQSCKQIGSRSENGGPDVGPNFLQMLSADDTGSKELTLCILMDFPIHIDTISMGLPIVYFKR